MLRKSRKVFGWLAARAPWVLGGLLAVSLAIPLMQSEPVVADGEVTKLKTVAMSDLAINERLLAVEALKVEGSTSALYALEDIARGGDLPVAAAACAALGRTGSWASKVALKDVFEDGNASDYKRMAAASAIAQQWKDEGDLSYLEDESESRTALKAHFAVLKAKVYGKGE